MHTENEWRDAVECRDYADRGRARAELHCEKRHHHLAADVAAVDRDAEEQDERHSLVYMAGEPADAAKDHRVEDKHRGGAEHRAEAAGE